MAAKEDTGEHHHPDPRPCDNADQRCETQGQKAGVCGKDPAGEFEDGDGFAEGVTAFVDGDRPKNGHQQGDEGEPAHSFVLNVVAADLALEAGDQGVEEEGEEDDGYNYQDAVDQRTDIRS